MHQECVYGSRGCTCDKAWCNGAAHLENKAVAGSVEERCIPGSSIGPGHGETEGDSAHAEVVHGRSAGERVPCAQAYLGFGLGGFVAPLILHPCSESSFAQAEAGKAAGGRGWQAVMSGCLDMSFCPCTMYRGNGGGQHAIARPKHVQ